MVMHDSLAPGARRPSPKSRLTPRAREILQPAAEGKRPRKWRLRLTSPPRRRALITRTSCRSSACTDRRSRPLRGAQPDRELRMSAGPMPSSEIILDTREPQDGSRLDLLRPIVEAAPDAMIVVDPNGQIILANRYAERMFGYGAGELTGCTIESLVPQRFAERHRDHRASFFREPRVRAIGSGLALAGLRKDG